MTQATQTKAPKKDVKDVKLDLGRAIEPCEMGRPLLMNCHAVVRGAELIPAKLIAILDYHLMNIQKDTGLLAITFRKDNRPSTKLGVSYPWAYAVSINLQAVFDKTWAKLANQDWGLNLRDAVWLGLIETCIHEITHIHMATADEKACEDLIMSGTDKDHEDDEKATREFAREFMIAMFKEVNCECPEIVDMGFLGGLLQERFITDRSHKYIVRSQQMLENDIAYEDKEKSVYYKTLRDYIRNNLVPVDTAKEDAWADDVNLVEVCFKMEDGSIIRAKADPVVDAEAAMPDVEQEAAKIILMAAGEQQPLPLADGAVEDDGDYVPDMDAIQDAMGEACEDFIIGMDGMEIESDSETIPMIEDGRVIAAPVATPVIPAQTVQSAEVADSPEAQLAARFNSQPEAAIEELPKLEIPAENIQACMSKIYLRLHSNIFLKGGWSLNQSTGRWTFAEPYAVTASIGVGDILTAHGCEGLIHEYVSFAEGQEVKPGDKAEKRYACSGYVQGFVFTNKGLPAYELHLNINGQRVVRRIVAQNPSKMTNNAYTKGADFAGIGGNRVSFVFKGEAPNNVPFNQRCSVKITNEQIQVLS